jgi:tetratricopeptide (TPR) repeat protein
MKKFLVPAAGILTACFLSAAFWMAGSNVAATFPVARMAALNNLQPQPADYFLTLNNADAQPDRNKVLCYVDYYQYLLRVFPNLWDAYGMLGYCYHYLGDDARAVAYLKTAIQNYPNYFWNYYNLAAIYIRQSNDEAAIDLLKQALLVPPVTTVRRLYDSHWVYLPFLADDQKKSLAYVTKHLTEGYRTSLFLAQAVSQVYGHQGADDLVKKINPELYAF